MVCGYHICLLVLKVHDARDPTRVMKSLGADGKLSMDQVFDILFKVQWSGRNGCVGCCVHAVMSCIKIA